MGASEAGAGPRGVRGFGAAAKLREPPGVPISSAYRAEYERDVGEARATRGDAAYPEAWALGQARTTEQAIAEALASV